jgi:putative endonuclease
VGFVYILQSETTGRFYIGSTGNLERRLSEHYRGKDRVTRGRGRWKLAYQERFELLADARRREFEIKQWKSAKLIHALIQSSVG